MAQPNGGAAPGSMGRFVGDQAPHLTPSFATHFVLILPTNALHEVDQASQVRCCKLQQSKGWRAGGNQRLQAAATSGHR